VADKVDGKPVVEVKWFPEFPPTLKKGAIDEKLQITIN